MIRSIPRRCKSYRSESVTKAGSVTRAILAFAPPACAKRQLSIFTSSESVTAITKSARSTRASCSTEGCVPSPQIESISRPDSASASRRGSASTITTLCFSSHKRRASCRPAFPAPIITIRIQLLRKVRLYWFSLLISNLKITIPLHQVQPSRAGFT